VTFAENTYGDAKRFRYVDRLVRDRGVRRVLDLGCGSGDLLTAPLAAAHPHVSVVGVDADAASLSHALARHRLPNLQFLTHAELTDQRFDLVIASEVIEHVETPADFLRDLQRRIDAGGVLLITLPNGYGPSELAATLEALLQVGGLYKLVRWLWRALGLRRPSEFQESQLINSLAVSPHINFFGHRAIRDCLAQAGFTVVDYRPRTFVCGFGFDHLVTLFGLTGWNARISDRLPPRLVSDWMLLSEPAPERAAAPYRRGVWARFRRRLNRWRWGVA
jgi:SAM-dependent methyltransferase